MDDRYDECSEDLRRAYLRVEALLNHGSMDESLAALMSLPSHAANDPKTKRRMAMVSERSDDARWFAAARQKLQGHVGGACKMSETRHAAVFTEPHCGLVELASDRATFKIQMRLAGLDINEK